MHIHFLDPYVSSSSPVHRLDARVKLVLTLAFIFTTALTPVGAWPIYILLFAIVLAIEILSYLGVSYVLRRSVLAFPFALAALPVIFTIPGSPLGSLLLGPWTLTATQPGVERFLSIAIKSWISVQAAIILASTTNFPDLMLAMRAIHIPRLLVSIFGLMWRYLFVLADEAIRLLRARQSRSGISDQPGLRAGGSLAWRAHITGGLAGSLFLRALERSDRIYMAMLTRGYDGEVRSQPLPEVSAAHRFVLFIGFFILLVLLAFALLLWR
jgi:cobalt/nickel transport system permease protein